MVVCHVLLTPLVAKEIGELATLDVEMRNIKASRELYGTRAYTSLSVGQRARTC